MKTIIVFSGGLDSTVLLNRYVAFDHECHALSVFYGQRHKRELEAARAVVRQLHNQGIPSNKLTHHVLLLPELQDILRGSSQTSADIEVPHGHYAAENMKQTVVPNRNMILLSLAIGYGVSLKADAVAYGAHQGDDAIYPDCRPAFVEAMQQTTALCDYTPPKLQAPFLTYTKADIAALGYREGAPMELSYSCYEGKREHCGKCGTCVERREAFQLAGITDPTIYAA